MCGLLPSPSLKYAAMYKSAVLRVSPGKEGVTEVMEKTVSSKQLEYAWRIGQVYT